ncbi:MAG: PIN domain-containing protein [Anaerolineae bacterium]
MTNLAARPGPTFHGRTFDDRRDSGYACSYLVPAGLSPTLCASISIVEIIYLIEKGRIPPATLPLLEEGLLERPALLEIIPVTNLIALTVQHVPRQQIPDLPDRIIAATALHLDVPLITRDRKIRLSDVATVW